MLWCAPRVPPPNRLDCLNKKVLEQGLGGDDESEVAPTVGFSTGMWFQ